MEIEEKKQKATHWFRELRDLFCASFQVFTATAILQARLAWPTKLQRFLRAPLQPEHLRKPAIVL